MISIIFVLYLDCAAVNFLFILDRYYMGRDKAAQHQIAYKNRPSTLAITTNGLNDCSRKGKQAIG